MYCEKHTSTPSQCPCVMLCTDCRNYYTSPCNCDLKRAQERIAEEKARYDQMNRNLSNEIRIKDEKIRMEKFNEIKEKILHRRSLEKQAFEAEIRKQAVSGVVESLTDQKTLRERQLEQELIARDNMLKKIQEDYRKRIEALSQVAEAVSEARADNLEDIQKRIDDNTAVIKKIENDQKEAAAVDRFAAMSQGRSPNKNPRTIPKKKVPSMSKQLSKSITNHASNLRPSLLNHE